MDAVSNIPELLETILLNPPIKDLLLAQRINKTFQAAILSSPKLQQALFLKPLAGSLLQYGVPPRAPQLWLESPEDPMHHVVHGNPFFHRFYGNSFFMKSTPAGFDMDAIQRPEASWRRMLVTQPPIMTSTPRKIFVCKKSTSSSNDRGNAKACLCFYGTNGSGSLYAGDTIRGLTIGEIEQHCALGSHAKGDYDTIIHIFGARLWEKVEHAHQVRRSMKPRPEFLLAKDGTADGEQ